MGSLLLDCRPAGRSRSCPRRHRQPDDFFCPLPGTAPTKCRFQQYAATAGLRPSDADSTMAAGGASFATGQVFTVGPGRGFCFFVAAASPALCQPLRGKASCRRKCIRTTPRPRHRTLPSDPSTSSAPISFLVWAGSCLVIATRRLLPGEGVGLVRTRSPLILRCARMRIYFGRCRRCAGRRPSIHRAHAPTNGRQ